MVIKLNGFILKIIHLVWMELNLQAYQDPPQIEEFISTYIDHTKIFERELKGKLQDFYDLIGWGDVVSEQRTAKSFSHSNMTTCQYNDKWNKY